MSSSRSVNEFVRRKLRDARLSRRMGVRELATKAGIPVSSYASMETGAYRINLDALFSALGVLDVDITDVWPSLPLSVSGCDNQLLYLKRLQEFRLGEILALSSAEGAALLQLKDKKCQVLMHQDLSSFFLDRLTYYLENKELYKPGLWWHRTAVGGSFHFFLKAEECPDLVRKLVSHYMVNWSLLFSRESSGQ